MNEAIVIAKLIFLITGMQVTSHAEGVGAFYHSDPGLMRSVCETRVAEGWNPGLDCSWSCLAAAIEPRDAIGEKWLVAIPGGSYHVCLIVDVAQDEHVAALLERGEVIELDYHTARSAGWQGFVGGVRVWRLDTSEYLGYTSGATDGRGFVYALKRGHAGHVYR